MHLFDNECFYFSGIKIKTNSCISNYIEDTCKYCIFYKAVAKNPCLLRNSFGNLHEVDCDYNQNFIHGKI